MDAYNRMKTRFETFGDTTFPDDLLVKVFSEVDGLVKEAEAPKKSTKKTGKKS